jgi:hypothetical protein
LARIPRAAPAPEGCRRANRLPSKERWPIDQRVIAFAAGDRVFHQKFGNGNVTAVDGNKLTIKFDHAGEKRVVDSFVRG